MKIGISQRILHHNGNAYDALDQNWYRFLKRFNVYPIPNGIDQNFKQLATDIDLFIISGGDESPIRLEVETAITNEMMIQSKPILGVCHGAFFLTSFLSGTVDNCDNHHNTFHEVIINTAPYVVNSFHRLQITNAPTNATILATDLQGYCESWILDNVGAIVWHPERMENPILPKKIIDKFFK